MLRMAAALALMALVAAGCDATGTFACARDDQCRGGPSQGTCELTGWCSFVDPACSSGQRYDQYAGDGYAGQCVGLPERCTAGVRGCEGRILRTCGADGWDPAQDVTCDFTCHQGACVDASNIPAAEVATCGPGDPSLAPPAGATITLRQGASVELECMPHCGDAAVTRIASRGRVEAGTIDLSWFCLGSVDIPAGVTLVRGGASQDAIAWLVDGSVQLAGTIDFVGAGGTQMQGGAGGPGAFKGGDRSASDGQQGAGTCAGSGGDQNGMTNNFGAGGGAGAGGGTSGGTGGDGRSPNNDHTGVGAMGAAVCGVETLVPLVGGSGGGGGGDGSCGGDCGWPGGGGGGALQISSRDRITISGRIDATGGAGFGAASGANGNGGGGGGGAGGALLLEAPAASVSGSLVVDGGAGGPSAAGPGGAGATGAASAMSGASFAAPGQGGSGGGGGGGRVRINVPGGSCANASPAAACTVGALTPR